MELPLGNIKYRRFRESILPYGATSLALPLTLQVDSNMHNQKMNTEITVDFVAINSMSSWRRFGSWILITLSFKLESKKDLTTRPFRVAG